MPAIGDILLSQPTSTQTFQDSTGASVTMAPGYMIESHKVTAVDTSNRPVRIRPIAEGVTNANPTNPSVINSLNPIIRLKDSFAFSSGNLVSEWKNSAGPNYNFQQMDTAKQPLLQANVINGKAAVYFDGVNDFLTLPANTLTEGVFTKFFVIKLTTPIGFIMEAKDSSYLWSDISSTSEVVKSANTSSGLLATGRNATSGWGVDNQVKIVCVAYNGTNASNTMTVNGGSNLLTGTSNEIGGANKTAGIVALGARADGSSPSKGFIGEFIQYDRALTPQEISNVVAELTAYWITSTPVNP